jgi:hypothetical protein
MQKRIVKGVQFIVLLFTVCAVIHSCSDRASVILMEEYIQLSDSLFINDSLGSSFAAMSPLVHS